MDSKISKSPVEEVSYDIMKPYLPPKEEINDILNKYEDLSPEKMSVVLQNIITVLRDSKEGSLYIYNRGGCYQPLPDWLLRSLFKYIVNVGNMQWESKFESETIGAYKRDITMVVKEFNTQNALNLKNGVLNLDTGAFRSHSPDTDFFTSVLDYEYDPEADCPVFKKFMAETCCNDAELEAVLQEILGYSLSTKVDAEAAFFFYGGGCNGKSVLSSILHSLIGEENTCAVPLESFSGTFSMTPFIGKKMNISGENGQMSNAEKLKTLISADRVNIPIKYQEDWVGKLYTKHIFLMNALPETPDVTHGFMRKIIIIPFMNQVPPESIDRDLTRKLKKELSGILNYCYEGYCRLVTNNYVFSHCEIINKTKREYMDRENPTGYFFRDTFVKKEGAKVKKSLIYKLYRSWCNANGYSQMTSAKFYRALNIKLKEPDYNITLDVRMIKGINYLFGYELKEDSSAADADIITPFYPESQAM